MTSKQKKRIIRIAVSSVLLVVALLLPFERYLRLGTFLVPYFIIGYDTLRGAVRKLWHRQMLDEEFLMSLATVGALILGDYAEAVAVMLFFEVGELFQSIAVGKSRKSIASLMDICPQSARIVDDEGERIVDPGEVRLGQVIRILPGERIPLDGKVISGSSTLDTSALSGESMPSAVEEGQSVLSGCVNLSSVIDIEVEREFSDSAVTKILELVENSSDRKSHTENFITRFARVYTPCVVGAAVLIAFVPPLFLGDFGMWVKRGLLFLVVSCPCALVISVPLAFFGGIGGASKKGILVKGAEYIEALSGCDTFVFDKTGTLTEGRFALEKTVCRGDENELLKLAASCEKYSNHPIAKAVANSYSGELYDVQNVQELAGKGISCTLDGKTLLCGSAAFCSGEDTDIYGSAVHVSFDGEYLGYILLCDKLKSGAKEVMAELDSLGIGRRVMLSGDRRASAEHVAEELSLEVYSELLPQDKLEKLGEILENKRKNICYVGDGINDSPCLKLSDVGISMGALGSDAAIEASDIVLTDDSLAKLPIALKISRKTMRIAKQNIAFALTVKISVMILGALGYVGMWAAVFADVGVSVIAILNSMRTLK